MKKLALFIAILALSIASAGAYRMSVDRVSSPILEIKERNHAIIEITPVSAKSGGNSSLSNCCVTGEYKPGRTKSESHPPRKSSCACCG